MKWLLVFLVPLSLATACVVEDKPVNGGTGGAGGMGGMGGEPMDECGGCSGDLPVCDTSTLDCVECLPGMEEACDDTAPVCDPTRKVCLCNEDTDCDTPELARCNAITEECAPCESDDDCDDLPDLPDDKNICNDGTCLDCTPDTESEACKNDVSCNPATNECTETEVGSLGVCDACVADSECGDVNKDPSDDHRCVPMFYPSEPIRFPDRERGFCLVAIAGGCEQPYSIRLEGRTSLTGAPPDDYCGIDESLTTCPAVADLLENRRCDSGEDTECFQPGGICRRVGVLINRCTYACGLAAQCPADAPANTCGPGDTELGDYCGG
jgi:hypothetical protein